MQLLSKMNANSSPPARRTRQRSTVTKKPALGKPPNVAIGWPSVLVYKPKNQLLWIEEGYKLFAEEGLDGIQVERLARMLGLNKSGFYHYFGELETYYTELVSFHQGKVSEFLHEVREIRTFDPEYLQLVMKYAITMMFQVQLTRQKDGCIFYEASEIADQRLSLAVHELWSEYIDDRSHSDLSMRYYFIIRDMFYTRVSFRKLNYNFLRNMVSEARLLFIELRQREPLGSSQQFAK